MFKLGVDEQDVVNFLSDRNVEIKEFTEANIKATKMIIALTAKGVANENKVLVEQNWMILRELQKLNSNIEELLKK